VKNPIQIIRKRITVAKLICLALLFSPLWGFWWFNIDPELWAGVGNAFVIPVCIKYLFRDTGLGIIYASVCLFAFVSFLIVTFIRPPLVRIPIMILMLVGWAFELSILDLNGALSSQSLLAIFWQESATAPEAVAGYGSYIIRDCALVLILCIVLCASPARKFSVSGIFGLLPIVSGVLVAGTTVYTKGGTQTFPIPFGTFSNAAIVMANASNSPTSVVKATLGIPVRLVNAVPPVDVDGGGPVRPIFNKIVMIMDESVRGDYISLNDMTQNTTPFLKRTDHLINFGVATSGGNCSHISRTLFRFGMRQSDLPDRWREGLNKPTFWQFARRAGYKTVHIDASFNNALAPAEQTFVNSSITVSDSPGYLRDHKLAHKLIQALNEQGPAFIYVQKYGVHFPYSTKFPPDFHPLPLPAESDISKYSNVIVRSLYEFLGSFLPPAGTLQNSDRGIAYYPNAIAWSVDEFFRNLLPSVDLSKTLIIYTSDHGQSLLSGHFTHCSTTPDVPLGEVYVPLFAITSMPEFEQRLEKGAARGFGRFSHFEIFPTLLLAMGYDAGWVNRTYGGSLMDMPAADRKFMIGSPDFQPTMIPVGRNIRPTSSFIGPRHAQMPIAGVN
jgi:glucan phosphoethanolaminetransferase (alkaline phosphatase superfamily)